MADYSADGAMRAAGAVVWRPGTAGTQVVLVHRPRYDDWTFPKGKSERGEHSLLTATREVAEETGLRVVLGRRLTASEYEVEGRLKRVSYWAATCGESLGFVPGHEVDEIAWFDQSQVTGQLTYDRDRVLLAEFTSGPPSTIPFVLLRHADAGSRLPDAKADLARPLDPGGAATADLLVALLSSYGTCRVISSAAQRCIATVRPYAEAVGVRVDIEPILTSVGDEGDDYGKSAWRLAELVADRLPTVVCAHRENLPALIDAARTALAAPPEVAGEALGKGSFVVLQSADGVLASSERHDPYPSLKSLPFSRSSAARYHTFCTISRRVEAGSPCARLTYPELPSFRHPICAFCNDGNSG